MIITDIHAVNLEIPYDGELRPAWRPGVVERSRDFTLARVATDEGVVGYAGVDGHLAGIVKRQVVPHLCGRSIYATENHARVFRNAGGAWFLDMAIWDIIGKAAGLPLYKLWGSTRETVQAYVSTAELGTASQRAELAAECQRQGFTALKLRFHHESLAEDLAILDRVIEAVGHMQIMVDANQATTLPAPRSHPPWDYYRALAAAKELQERGVVWLEEPLSRYNFQDLQRLREQTCIYTAGGEKNRGLHELYWLAQEGVYDIIQPDPAMSEGISQLRKVAGLCEMLNRPFVPHHGLSGLGLAAATHLACCFPGWTWVEMMYEPRSRTVATYQQLGGILQTPIWINSDGSVSPPEGAGLGVDVDEDKVEQYAV